MTIGFPKPPRTPPKSRKPLPPSSHPIPRGGKPKPVNQSRRAREYARTYHSKERVVFVKGLRCVAAVGRCEGEIVNAHVTKDYQSGAGRKSGYRSIAPLCVRHHHELDATNGPRAFEGRYQLDLSECAAETERAWLTFAGDGKP